MGVKGLVAVGVVATAMLLVGCAPPPRPVPVGPPATIVVDTTADVINRTDGVTSVREAFIQASNDNADTTIVLQAGAEYRLTSCGGGSLGHGGPRPLVVTTDGPSRATIRQTCPYSRVMVVAGPAVRLERLTLTGGQAASAFSCGVPMYGWPDCARGAGMVSTAPLVLDDVAIVGNRSVGLTNVDGGGLAVAAGATIIDSEFADNSTTMEGGAIVSVGNLMISGTTFENNTANAYGGAIAAESGTVTITDSEFRSNVGGSGGAIAMLGASTISATDTVFRLNRANGGPGGGIYMGERVADSVALERVAMVENYGNAGAALTLLARQISITDSTITDNRTDDGMRDRFNRASGGLVTNSSAQNITITGSTIAHNIAPPGGGANIDLPASDAMVVTVRSSIISDPQWSPDNCEMNGNLFVVDDSLVSDGTCGTAASALPADLGPLTESGGTWFRTPGASGGALDVLAAPCATASDQRGVARPQGAGCDLGAIEG